MKNYKCSNFSHNINIFLYFLSNISSLGELKISPRALIQLYTCINLFYEIHINNIHIIHFDYKVVTEQWSATDFEGTHMHTDHLTTLLRSSLEPISVGWGQTHVLPEESAHTHTHKHIAKGFLSPRSALPCSLQPAKCLASHFSQVSQPRYTSLFTNQHLCLLQPRIEWLRYYRVWSVLFFEVKGDSLW